MNLVKTWFLSRLLREKVLVFAFLLLGALIWLSSAWDGLQVKTRAFRSANAELKTQQLWLDNRVAIEEAAASAASHLDSTKTYDATSLATQIDGMARRAGLAVNTEPPRTQRSPQFAVHTLQVTTRRAELSTLLRFYQELAAKSPYLGLEQISVQGDRGAPGMLNATLQIASVELLGAAPVRRAAQLPAAPAAPAPVEPVPVQPAVAPSPEPVPAFEPEAPAMPALPDIPSPAVAQ